VASVVSAFERKTLASSFGQSQYDADASGSFQHWHAGGVATASQCVTLGAFKTREERLRIVAIVSPTEAGFDPVRGRSADSQPVDAMAGAGETAPPSFAAVEDKLQPEGRLQGTADRWC